MYNCNCRSCGVTSFPLVSPQPCAARAALFECDFSPERMDFVPVPAGTVPAAALALRGADHDLDFAAGDSIEVALGDLLRVRLAVGGRRRLGYSSFSGVLSGYFFSNDRTVINMLLTGQVPAAAKLRALWLYFTANGVVATSALTHEDFAAAADAILEGLNLAALPAAFLLTAADMHAVEP